MMACHKHNFNFNFSEWKSVPIYVRGNSRSRAHLTISLLGVGDTVIFRGCVCLDCTKSSRLSSHCVSEAIYLIFDFDHI